MSDTMGRSRESGPEQETRFDQNQRAREERIQRKRVGRVVLKHTEALWEQTRQGKLMMFTHADNYESTDPKDLPAMSSTTSEGFNIFTHEIRTKSGRHRHQGGLVIYVVKGTGYTTVDVGPDNSDVKVEWKEGDLILLPVRPEEVEHQHFNTGDEPAMWCAFRYEPFHDALGDEVVQVVNAPDWE